MPRRRPWRLHLLERLTSPWHENVPAARVTLVRGVIGYSAAPIMRSTESLKV